MGKRMLRAGKWVLLALSALAALSPLGMVVLARQAEKRLDETLKALAATGAPVELSDLARPPIPDEENAALVYQQAFQAIELAKEDYELVWEITSGKSDLADLAVAAQVADILTRNKRALELIHQASFMPDCDFQRDWSRGSDVIFPEFAELHKCSRLLTLESLMLLKAGLADEALEACGANFRLSNAANESLLIAQGCRYRIISIATRTLGHILDGSQASAQTCRALAEEIGKIDINQSYLKALETKRVIDLSFFKRVKSAPNPLLAIEEFTTQSEESSDSKQHSSGSWSKILFRWALAVDEQTFLQLMERAIQEARLPYRETVSIKPSIEEAIDSLPRWPPPLVTVILYPSHSGDQMVRDRAAANLGLGEISLLLKAYKAERGRYPESLEQLGKYEGRSLPEDPFSGEAFVYHREGEGFVLYSWGPNLKDEGGEPPPPKRWYEGDIVIRCAR
jgi:hypothetical protein